MKKTILAALLFTAIGTASAQVTLGGKVSEWVDNTKNGVSRDTSLVTEPTSNIAVSVRERLGNGMTARAVVETSLSGNTFGGSDTRLGDRQATVGLANKWGSLDFGRNVHSQFLAITTNDVFGTLYGSVAGDVHNLRGLRFGDAVFASVTPVKGLTLTAERSQADAVRAQSYSASGSIGPVKTTAAVFEQGGEKSTVVGLNTNVAGTTLTYIHSDDTGVVKSKGDTIGASRRMGQVTAKASYGKTNTDTTAYAVGMDYHLSKRTEVGLAFKNVDRAGKTADVSQVGVGLTHRF